LENIKESKLIFNSVILCPCFKVNTYICSVLRLTNLKCWWIVDQFLSINCTSSGKVKKVWAVAVESFQ